MGSNWSFAAIGPVSPGATFFCAIDKVLKLWEKYGSKAIRQRAIRKAEQWMLEHTRHTDGVAAIYPPMMYVIMALDLLGYRARQSGACGSAAPVRQADGERRTAVLLPALLFGGVGHRHRGVRAGRSRSSRRTTLCAARPTGC